MSFQFSQNLLAEIESSQSQGASLTQMTQSQNLMDCETQSQSLLDNSSNPQFNRFQNNPSMPRSMAQNVSNFGRNSASMSRLERSRFHTPPDRINVEVAKTLKGVQSGLEEFPGLAARMLEEGLDYLGGKISQDSESCQTKTTTLKETFQTLMGKLSEKDKKLSDLTGRFLKELESITEEVNKMKDKQTSYEQVIEQLVSIIEKQKSVIEQLKSNSLKSQDDIAEVGQFPYSNLKVKDFARDKSPKRLLQLLSTPSSSESVRKFCFKSKSDVFEPLDLTFSDSEDDDILVDTSVNILEDSKGSITKDFIELISLDSDDDGNFIIEE